MKRFLTMLVLVVAAAISLANAATYSGTLPVLFINTENGAPVDSKEVYLNATYWLDPMGVEGVEAFGSEAEPLATQIKGRGNYTWSGFDKKPYRLKLGAKAGLLGMKKNKHFGLLAHADDQFGWLKNTLGFELSKRLGLAWTPSQAPVEVVLNGDYIGLYMLTELIRVEKDRVNIVEQPDNITNTDSITGGWLVEIDNYDEAAEEQIQITEGTGRWGETMRFTHKSPELLSSAQENYLRNLVTAANAAIYNTDKSSTDWENYIDIDALARFYIVQEIMNNQESFHGSCYWHKDMGADTKMVFGPVWDFGNSFNSSNILIHTNPPFHQHWIGEIYKYPRFKAAVEKIWKEFKGSDDYATLDTFIDNFASYISSAAVNDAQRWPQYAHSNTASLAAEFKNAKNAKTSFLVEQWGDGLDPSVLDGLSKDEDEQAVFFIKPDSWAGNIYAWIWRSSNTSVNYTGGSWPGQQLTEVKQGVYKWTYSGVDEIPDDALVIFSDSGNPQTDGAGFAYVNGGVYDVSGYYATVGEGGGDTPDPDPQPEAECYLIGKVNGKDWAYNDGVAMTKSADGIFTAEVSLVADDYFAVATSLAATNWDDLAANYRYGPTEEGAVAYVDVATAMARNGNAWKIAETGTFTVTVNFNNSTLLIASQGDTPDPEPEAECYLIGKVNGKDWAYNDGVAMTKSADGIFTAEVSLVADDYFAVATSLAATDWDDLATNYRYGPAEDGAVAYVDVATAIAQNGNAWKIAETGTFTVTVNFNNSTLLIASQGDTPDPEPEGECYLIGQVNGKSWAYDDGVAMTQTSDGIFTAEVSLEADDYFSVATSLAATSWGDLNENYRFGPVADQDEIQVGTEQIMVRGGNAWRITQSGTFTVTVNLNEATILVATQGDEPEPEPNNWTVYFDKPDDWSEPIYSYVYTVKDGGAVQVASWPGEEMTLLKGNRYKYTFTLELGNATYVLFSESGGNQTAGDPGFVFVNNAVYDFNGYKSQYVMPGDINADGSIDGSDVSALLEMVLSGGLTDDQTEIADLTGDGSVDGSDVSALLEMVLSGE